MLISPHLLLINCILLLVAGKEFYPKLEVKRLPVVKLIYGTQTSDTWFHESLSANLCKFQFNKPSVDLNLLMRKLKGGGYEYIDRWVDNVLCFSDAPHKIMDYLGTFYILKGVYYPQFYLGGDVVQISTNWDQDYDLSVHTCIKNCVGMLELMCEITFTPVNIPFYTNYCLEENTSKLYCPEEHYCYRWLIGIINWCINLRCFDIYYLFNTLFLYSVAPRKAYFAAAQNIFGYLKKDQNWVIVVDQSTPSVQIQASFHFKCNWFKFFLDEIKDLFPKWRILSGVPIKITSFANTDNALNCVTRHLIIGIIILSNNTPFVWISHQ